MLTWLTLTMVAVIYRAKWVEPGLPWYSYGAYFIVFPLIAAFLIYGPIMLVQQVRRSGGRGRVVLKAWLVAVAILVIVTSILYFFMGENWAKVFLGVCTPFWIFHELIGFNLPRELSKDRGVINRD
jgi:hypothetical protein